MAFGLAGAAAHGAARWSAAALGAASEANARGRLAGFAGEGGGTPPEQ
jgi:hypothetical protein